MLLFTIISSTGEVVMDDKYIALETMIAARDSANWAFWSMIGTWFAGSATLLAVVLSLYLANRRTKPRLQISVDGCLMNLGAYVYSGISITVANAAESNVVVTSMYWEMASHKKLAQIFIHPLSAKLPTKLSGGESATYFIEMGENNGWLQVMLKNIEECDGKLHKLTLCVSLASGTKVRFKAKNLISTLKNLPDQ
jgi:hypothetical protein